MPPGSQLGGGLMCLGMYVCKRLQGICCRREMECIDCTSFAVGENGLPCLGVMQACWQRCFVCCSCGSDVVVDCAQAMRLAP